MPCLTEVIMYVLLFSLLMQALSDVLRDIYRTLKHSLTFDPDDQVKVHTNLALAEIDDIMREALFAPPERSKKITILGLQ